MKIQLMTSWRALAAGHWFRTPFAPCGGYWELLP